MVNATEYNKLKKAKDVRIIPTLYNPEHARKLTTIIHTVCPFHSDSSPSFAYYVNTNSWYCFSGCGGGDAVAFYQKMYEVDFKTALEEMGKL